MPQILVGGDNQDAYSICDALERMCAPSGQLVVFCATPHEVLSTLGRGGVLAAVLNFEAAGLTNFELACRIRETGDGRTMPLLLPEIDALGDVTGVLGTQVGTFAFPVKPGAVAALACKLLDAAPKTLPPPPAAAAPAGPATAKPAAAAASDPARSRPDDLDAVSPGPSRHAASAQPGNGPSSRRRRVRHRTWQEVRSPRREPVLEAQPEDVEEDDPAATASRPAAADSRPQRARRLALVLGLVAVLALAYGGYRVLRSDGEADEAASPTSMTALLCVACGNREARAVQDIHDLRCRQCGGQLGFAFHCNDCKTDFGFAPPENVKTLDGLQSKPECPKCKSWNTTALQPTPPAAAEPKTGGAASAGTKTSGAAPQKAAPKAARDAKPRTGEADE